MKYLALIGTLFYLALPTQAVAQMATGPGLSGFWSGSYTCNNLQHPLLLQMQAQGAQVQATFGAVFQGTVPLQFALAGQVRRDRKGAMQLNLKPQYWTRNPGPQFSMVGIQATVRGTQLHGKILFPSCGAVQLQRLPCEVNPAACSPAALGVLSQFGAIGGQVHVQIGMAPPIHQPMHQPAHQPMHQPAQAPAQKPKPSVSAMADNRFRGFMAQLRDAAFSRDRVDLIESTARRNQFNCEQLKSVISELNFEKERVAAISAWAPKLVDPDNSYVVIGALTFAGEKRKAREIFDRLP